MPNGAVTPRAPASPRRLIALLAATLMVWSQALGMQPAPETPAPAAAVPAYRQADKVVVITLDGGIDAISAMSVRRRVEQAEKAGANALVLEVNSPGGEVGAVLEITNAIKGSSIANTVAWVHPDAYSGGAISALACREIVTSSPASMGDAFPVTIAPGAPGQMPGSLRGLTPAERTKILPVLLADVTDSARRGGYDEYLVQAIIIDGIELWWARDDRTGAEFAVNEAEYRMLFGRQPVRGKPILAGVTGGVSTVPEHAGPSESEDLPPDAATPDAATPDAATPPPTPDAPQGQHPRDFRPASDSLGDVAREFDSPERTDLRIELESQRPVLTPDDAGHFTDLGYLCDGTSAIVMREDQLQRFGFSNAVVQNDEQLGAYLGATTLLRVDESWSEKFVRFMTGFVVRGVLIAVMLIALFLEMVSPGLTIPGAIAAGCLVLLLAPPALVGMAGWWEIVAIIIGIVLLALEAFVIPGFGLFGVLGIVALFGGLLGTFIPAGGSLTDPSTQGDLMKGATAILLAMITAGIGMYFVSKNFNRLPILDKLVLGAREDEEILAERAEIELLQAAARPAEDGVAVGMTGVAVTALRPSGQAEVNGRMVDVVCDLGLVDAGTPVRVVKIEGWRVVVTEARKPGPDPRTPDGEGIA